MPADKLDAAKLNGMAHRAGSPTAAVLEIIKQAVGNQVNEYAEWASPDHGADDEELDAAAAYTLNMIAGSAMAASVMVLCKLGLAPENAKAFTVQQVTRLAQSSMEQAVTEQMIERGIAREDVAKILTAARTVHASKEDPDHDDV